MLLVQGVVFFILYYAMCSNPVFNLRRLVGENELVDPTVEKDKYRPGENDINKVNIINMLYKY